MRHKKGRGTRLSALAAVAVLVALLGVLPGLTPRAGAAPRTVTVAVHDLEPFVMMEGTGRSGFTIDLIEAVAKRVGWTLRYVNVDGVEAQLSAVVDGRADSAATAIEITSARARDVDFSQPVLSAGLQIMVPTSQLRRSEPGIEVFLELLASKTMMIWLGAALLLSVIPAHILWLSERRHRNPMVPRPYFRGVTRAFGWSVGMLAGQPPDFPRHPVGRSLGNLWAFVGVVFVAYYTATLTANVTVAKIDAQISALADLVGKRVCTVADTQAATFLESVGVRGEGAADIRDCYTALTRGQLDAIVFDSAVLRYYVAHEGANIASLVGTVFEPADYGVAFPNASPLTEEFNQGLLSLREDGFYEPIVRKWFGFDILDPSASGS